MSTVCDTTTIIGWGVNCGQLLSDRGVGIGPAILATNGPHENGAFAPATVATEPVARLPTNKDEMAALAAVPIPTIVLAASW